MDGPLMLVHFYPREDTPKPEQGSPLTPGPAHAMSPRPAGKAWSVHRHPAPHGYGLMMTQINQNQHLLNRSPGAATHIWIEKWLLCWCGQLKKDSVPYLVVWKGKKKKLSEGKDHRETCKHAQRDHILL